MKTDYLWSVDPETSTRGKIQLAGLHFANYFTMPADWCEHAGKVCFNRDMVALKMKCPVIEPQNNLNELFARLNDWLASFTSVSDEEGAYLVATFGPQMPLHGVFCGAEWLGLVKESYAPESHPMSSAAPLLEKVNFAIRRNGQTIII